MKITKQTSRLAVLLTLLLGGCSAANIDETKSVAEERWKELGFKVVGYEGYQWGMHVWPGYGGAHVWYALTRDNTGHKVTYTGSLQKWGDEYHNNSLRAVDAVKGN